MFDGIPLGRPEVADAIAAAVAGPVPRRARRAGDRDGVPVGKCGRVFNPERVQVNWR